MESRANARGGRILLGLPNILHVQEREGPRCNPRVPGPKRAAGLSKFDHPCISRDNSPLRSSPASPVTPSGVSPTTQHAIIVLQHHIPLRGYSLYGSGHMHPPYTTQSYCHAPPEVMQDRRRCIHQPH